MSSVKNKKYKYCFVLILFISVLLRSLILIKDSYNIENDTGSYITAGILTYYGQFNHPYRTPIYPVFLRLTFAPFGGLTYQYNSQQFKSAALFTSAIQSIIGIISVIIIYLIIKQLIKGLFWRYIVLIICLLSPFTIKWESYLMPETINIFWVLWMTYLLIMKIHKLTNKDLIIFLFLSVMGFLLRPYLILYPIIIFVLILLFYKNISMYLKVGIFISIYIFFVSFYIYLNFKTYDYLGISRVSDINLLGKALQYRFTVKNISKLNELNTVYKSFISDQNNPSPWVFIKNNEHLFNKYENQLGIFSRILIKTNFSTYVLRSLLLIPRVITEVLYSDNADFIHQDFFNIEKIYSFLHFCMLSILFFIPINIYMWFKQPKYYTPSIIVASTILYQVIIVSFFSYGEYGRLMSVVYPLMYIYFFFWIQKIIYFL